jgi:isocitrate lyase
MYQLARGYARSGMTAYSQLQQKELEMAENLGYTAVKHQRFVGTGYFDAVATTIANGQTSNCTMPESTEEEQFEMHTEDYNDGEATERTPMPHLYILLEDMPLPSTAAND